MAPEVSESSWLEARGEERCVRWRTTRRTVTSSSPESQHGTSHVFFLGSQTTIKRSSYVMAELLVSRLVVPTLYLLWIKEKLYMLSLAHHL